MVNLEKVFANCCQAKFKQGHLFLGPVTAVLIRVSLFSRRKKYLWRQTRSSLDALMCLCDIVITSWVPSFTKTAILSSITGKTRCLEVVPAPPPSLGDIFCSPLDRWSARGS